MMRQFIYILGVLTFMSMFSCKYLEPSVIRGRVYEIIQGDTTNLDSVEVSFYITEKYDFGAGRLTYDTYYSIYTDHLGDYQFSFKPVPYPTIYELTFGRKGYVFESSQIDIEDFDFPGSFIHNQALSKGVFKDYYFERHQKLKIDQRKIVFAMAVLASSLMLLIIFFLRYSHILWLIPDLVRRLNKKSFDKLSNDGKSKILSQAWCENCGKCNMNNPHQKVINGTPYIMGSCSKCGAAIEIRIK